MISILHSHILRFYGDGQKIFALGSIIKLSWTYPHIDGMTEDGLITFLPKMFLEAKTKRNRNR